MSLFIRCPICGMQVKLSRVRPRPVVAVEVGSKGNCGIFHKVVPSPPFVLKRVKDVLETVSKRVSLYDFDKGALPFLIQESYLSLEPDCVYQPIFVKKEVIP